METSTGLAGLTNLDQWGLILGNSRVYSNPIYTDHNSISILNMIFGLNKDISKYHLKIRKYTHSQQRSADRYYSMTSTSTDPDVYYEPSRTQTLYMIIIEGVLKKGVDIEMNVNATNHSWEFVVKLVDNNMHVAKMYQMKIICPTYGTLIKAIEKAICDLTA